MSQKATANVGAWVAGLLSMALFGLGLGQDVTAEPTGQPIRPGDRLQVDVFNEAALSGAFEVTLAGTINFPLLGKLDVTGKSVDQLGAEIESTLETDYIRDAQVSVGLAGRRAQSVRIIGQVTSPGEVQFEPGSKMDLYTAVASAGGVTEAANPDRLELSRRDGDELTAYTLSLNAHKSYELLDGDTVIVRPKPQVKEVVEELKTFTAMGQVRRPGPYELPKSGQVDILKAIAQAGGLTPLAQPKKVIVRRTQGGGTQTKELNVKDMQEGKQAPFIILPDDVITVKESVF